MTPVPVPGYDGWAVGAEVSGADWQAGLVDPLLVFSVHVPAGPGGYHGQTNHILDAIRRLAGGMQVLIGGDFNVAVTDGPGAWRPTTRAERAIQVRLADEFGLSNCWRAANPDVPPAQTLRWTGDRTTPYHCDGLFVPAAWADRLASCEVLAGGEWEALSDHNPVVARFRSTPARHGTHRITGSNRPSSPPQAEGKTRRTTGKADVPTVSMNRCPRRSRADARSSTSG